MVYGFTYPEFERMKKWPPTVAISRLFANGQRIITSRFSIKVGQQAAVSIFRIVGGVKQEIMSAVYNIRSIS